MQYAIGERIDIQIDRDESGFDRACDAAYRMACGKFGADDNGHLRNVTNSERSTDSIIVEFASYRRSGSMVGTVHTYSFVAWVERADEPGDK